MYGVVQWTFCPYTYDFLLDFYHIAGPLFYELSSGDANQGARGNFSSPAIRDNQSTPLRVSRVFQERVPNVNI